MARTRSGSATGTMPLALELLAADHRKVEDLFQQFEDEKDGDEATKRALAQTICGELTAHASGSSDLARLYALAADGRLDAQVELECSWRQPAEAIDALLNRRIGGKAVLHID